MALRKALHKVSFAHCPVHASCAPVPPKKAKCIASTFHHTQKKKQLSIYNTDLFVHVYQNTNNLIISADQSIINQYSPFRPLARGHAARQMVELDMDSEDDDTTEADSNETQTFEENGMDFG